MLARLPTGDALRLPHEWIVSPIFRGLRCTAHCEEIRVLENIESANVRSGGVPLRDGFVFRMVRPEEYRHNEGRTPARMRPLADKRAPARSRDSRVSRPILAGRRNAP